MLTLSHHELDRVTRICRQQLRPPLDYEDIAVGIFIESCENGHDSPSYEFVRNRCRDHLRAHLREHKVLEETRHIPRTSTPPETHVENEILVNHLTSVLSMEEKKIIIYRYINDFTPAAIARKLRLAPERVAEILATAIFKMREFA